MLALKVLSLMMKSLASGKMDMVARQIDNENKRLFNSCQASKFILYLSLCSFWAISSQSLPSLPLSTSSELRSRSSIWNGDVSRKCFPRQPRCPEALCVPWLAIQVFTRLLEMIFVPWTLWCNRPWGSNGKSAPWYVYIQQHLSNEPG